MVSLKSLPHINNIYVLAKIARPFPVTAGSILDVARGWNFGSSTINFLKLFPADTTFDTADDFLSRSCDLETILRQQRRLSLRQIIKPGNVRKI